MSSEAERATIGPAVMLCNSDSIFPRQLAAWWRRAGLDTVMVTRTGRLHADTGTIDGFRVVDVDETWGRPAYRAFDSRLARPILRRIEQRLLPRYVERRRRSIDAPQLLTPLFAAPLMMAAPLARAALSVKPRFVFGHEVTTYGLATAMARGVPRILFPWGNDIFGQDESTPIHRAIARYALRNVDLIVPTSTTAAEHLVKRYGVSPERIVPVSWGVDLGRFQPSSGARRDEIKRCLGFDAQSLVIANVRRFRPEWGAWTALNAFLQIAREEPRAHFVLFGGRGTEGMTPAAIERISDAGFASRFLVLEGETDFELFTDVLSVTDIFTSIAGGFDMRSSSVLQASAAGAAPLVGRQAEYELMQRQGFAVRFVDPADPASLVDGLRSLIVDDSARSAIAAANARYLAVHEDHDKQMRRLLAEIERVCRHQSK